MLRVLQIMVHGLPFDYDHNALRNMFSQAGPIVNVHIFKDQQSQRSKGYGLVCFAAPEVGLWQRPSHWLYTHAHTDR